MTEGDSTSFMRSARRWILTRAPALRAVKKYTLKVVKSVQPDPVRKLMETYFKADPAVFFVQVGSNDGKGNDPLRSSILRNPGWRGILVEPVPFVFARLKDNYDHSPRLIFENVAVADVAGKLAFYHLRHDTRPPPGERLPVWYDQIGSFDRNHVEKHFGSWISEFIVTADVECVTLPELFEKHEVKTIDLLHTDAEGYDAAILRQLDLQKYAPRMIIFEHAHMAPSDRAEIRARLSAHGYRMQEFDGDTIATMPTGKS